MRKSILMMFVLTLCLSLISVSGEVQTLGTFKKGNCINLVQSCANCTYSNITSVLYPNSTVIIRDVVMTKINTNYNYTFCYTNYSGSYIVNGISDVDGTDTAWAYDFVINPIGIAPTDQRSSAITRSILIVVGLGVLLFLGFLIVNSSPPVKYTFLVLALLFFLIGLNIMFVALQDEVVNPKIEGFFDSFIAISYYLYWFIAGFLALLWLFTFLNTYFYKKNEQHARSFGNE